MNRYQSTYDGMDLTPEGEWVAYDDHIAALTAARAERDQWRDAANLNLQDRDAARAEVARLQGVLSERRDEIADARAEVAALEVRAREYGEASARWAEQAGKAEAEVAALKGNIKHACLCRWASVDGNVGLQYECDGHRQTRLARNAALEREQQQRARAEQAEATAARLREALEWCRRAALDIANAAGAKPLLTRVSELADAAEGIANHARAALAAKEA